MKIEKVNEHQIRCTLTREDLLNRELKISELAYGTEKAKSLFRDMMQQAAYECGFEAEDIPLMIEAIPLNAECIVLIVTKVEDPEELDTRFSKFAPSVHDEESFSDETEALMDSFADGADEVLNMLRKMNSSSADVSAPQSGAPASKASASKNNKDASSVKTTSRLFSFSSLRDVTRLARVISTSYQDANSLYKDDSSGRYLLLLNPGALDMDAYNRICSLISEYAKIEKTAAATNAYLEEHYEPLIQDKALEVLASI